MRITDICMLSMEVVLYGERLFRPPWFPTSSMEGGY